MYYFRCFRHFKLSKSIIVLEINSRIMWPPNDGSPLLNDQLSESPRVSTVPSSLPEEIEYTYAMSSKADEEVAMTLNFLQQNCMQVQKNQGDLQQKTTRIHQLETYNSLIIHGQIYFNTNTICVKPI